MMEAGGLRGGLHMCEDERAEAAAGEVGMDEDSSDFGGVNFWIEEIGLANGRPIAAEEGLAFGPSAAAGENCCAASIFGFNDEVSLVADQLRVESEDCAQGAFDLGWGVVVGLQAADGGFDERVQGWDIGLLRGSDVPDCIGLGHRAGRISEELWPFLRDLW